ncbi:MAG: hypothetical protein NZ811_00040 [Gammaproteobacteria bacterium]|nr:hypothetical protein [Gammaproteobacteria bacterium]
MDTYNGWTNRETWLVNLWMGDELQSLVESETDLDDLRDALEAYVYNYYEEANIPDMFRDFIYLDSVNWLELARNYTDEAK